ncbi:hypothetical protein LOK49_LG08G02273 [Camellia lanceoleosa]|uniref:Uncharacterized protein n=1 Tax=Camellia lanceoleosa TaxID=1840588 RepID=A0ACC0GPJ4_9ERIC|nr:hypothetical protein LOK49_LG08G02273 [Camellia lanceoleosa]
MWRRLSTQLHRFAAAANISSTPRSPFRPSTISFSCSVTSNYGTKAAGSFNHHEMQYSTTMLNDPDIHEDFRPTNKLESSGLSLKDIVEQDVRDNPVMLYMKGVPDLPRCGFSSPAVRVLKEYNVPLSARNILEDPELENAVKAYRGLLKFTTNRGRIYLSTSRRNFRGTDMFNNDHMMITFLAVTSTSAMAVVPFAMTAIIATMMSPTMTMTSSTVTTIVATMSVITVTMLMNMMSPAVTVMPSAMASCTSVMSTGVVVS